MSNYQEPRPLDTVVIVCPNCEEYQPHFVRIRGNISTGETWREVVCEVCENVTRRADDVFNVTRGR